MKGSLGFKQINDLNTYKNQGPNDKEPYADLRDKAQAFGW